jgi:hypothetical protein
MACGLPEGLKKTGRNKFFKWSVLTEAVLFSLILLGFIVIQNSGFKHAPHLIKLILAPSGKVLPAAMLERFKAWREQLPQSLSHEEAGPRGFGGWRY